MVLGIDGGGTKTTFVICDLNAQPLFQFDKGPTAIRSFPFEKVVDTLVEGILEAFNLYPAIQAITMGLGDVCGPEDEKRLLEALRPRLEPLKPLISVYNDVVIAHAGSLEGEAGFVLISGTGAVAYGSDGINHHRVGGISYQEGDDGSGYYCGKMALKSLIQAMDGRIKSSPMIEALNKDLGLKSFLDYVTLFERLHLDRHQTAQYAKYVTRYAALGDPNAEAIIKQAVMHLVALIKPLNQRFKVTPRQLALVGSLAQEEAVFKPMLTNALSQMDPELSVFNAKKSPAIGACIIALKPLKTT